MADGWLLIPNEGEPEVFTTELEASSMLDRLLPWEKPGRVAPLVAMTKEEIAAIEASARYWAGPFRARPHAAVLRKLLERLKREHGGR
jgi:hypothetical protein